MLFNRRNILHVTRLYEIIQREQRQIALGQMFGLKLDKPGVITPKQAIKMGVPAGVVGQMSDEPLGEWRLVEVTTDKARKAFGT